MTNRDLSADPASARLESTAASAIVHIDCGGHDDVIGNGPADVNLRSSGYFIVSAVVTCWHCGESTCVVGLALPPGHMVLELGDDAPDGEVDAGLEDTRHLAGNASSQRNSSDSSDSSDSSSKTSESNRSNARSGNFRDANQSQPWPGVAHDSWSVAPHNAVVFYVEYVADGARSRLTSLARSYRLGGSENSNAEDRGRVYEEISGYWANHCQHCGSLLDDHELHCEPDAGFVPTSVAGARSIRLSWVDEPIEVTAAGYSIEPQFFDALSRD